MKRITLFLIVMVLMAGSGLKSQTPPVEGTAVLNYSGLEAKLKKSDEDIQNAKKNIKAKTWTSRAQILIDIYNIHNDVLNKGMEPLRAKLFLKEPKEIQTSQEGANKVETYVYDRVDLKFVNGLLDSWTEKNKIIAEPIPEAQKALDEAIKLNTDKKADDDILKVTQALKLAYQNEAVNNYEKANFKNSYENFVHILDLNKSPQLNNRIDTIIIYYTGRAAFENKDYTNANKYFEETAALNFKDPLLYVLRKQCLFAMGDTAKGIEIMKEGYNKHPEDQSIMIELINYYLDANEAEEALKIIAIAKAGDPTNVSYSFTEGTLYDKMGRVEDAEKAYKECIAIKPDYVDAYYNLGVLYYNKAVKIYEEASKISDNATFEARQKDGDETLKLAIPYMEKVAEINPKDQNASDTKRSALETLKTIYYRLKMEDKRQEIISKLNAL